MTISFSKKILFLLALKGKESFNSKMNDSFITFSICMKNNFTRNNIATAVVEDTG